MPAVAPTELDVLAATVEYPGSDTERQLCGSKHVFSAVEGNGTVAPNEGDPGRLDMVRLPRTTASISLNDVYHRRQFRFAVSDTSGIGGDSHQSRLWDVTKHAPGISSSSCCGCCSTSLHGGGWSSGKLEGQFASFDSGVGLCCTPVNSVHLKVATPRRRRQASVKRPDTCATGRPLRWSSGAWCAPLQDTLATLSGTYQVSSCRP